ncbi:MAG: LuxR C-terminal-related transcriptional regulator [Chloroflexi bacterium]|nr:LuxR C-terminal-related transcriptional regulator [Chloroflexota bacterium]
MANRESSKLTQREREVVALVAWGLTNQEIADQLSISTSAVKICLHQSCIKLGAQNRAQAVISAFKELIALARTHQPPFEAVLVWKLNRFARS